MEKRMEPLTVFTKGELIWIEQSGGGEDAGIVINPDQVPVLIEWLKEATAELAKSKEAKQGRHGRLDQHGLKSSPPVILQCR